MIQMLRRVGLCLLLGLIGWGAPRAAASLLPGADGKWRRYESPHFELYSRASDSDSRQVLNNLELVQAIFFESFGFKPVRAMPVTVFLFSRERFFDAYKPEAFRRADEVSAFYYQGIARGYMTIAPLPTLEAAQQTAFGSYTHHMFGLTGAEPPLWFSYGLAGVMRNIEIFTDDFAMGKAKGDQVERLQRANLVPAEVMLAADQQSTAFQDNLNSSLIHDESWALVHYLYFGQHKVPPAQVHRFIETCLAQGKKYDREATVQALATHLGMDFKKLDGALESYFRSGRYGWSRRPLPKVAGPKSYQARPVPLAEINVRLGELALRVSGSTDGKLALQQELEKSPGDTRILEALGTYALQQGERDLAHERWERAIAAGSLNPAVLRHLIEAEDTQRFHRFDAYYRLPDEAATELRARIAQYREIVPQDPLSWEVLAWVEATSSAPQIANLNAVQKEFDRLGRRSRTLLALAWARVRLKDSAGAEELLQILDKGGPEIAWSVEVMRAQNEGRQPRKELSPASSQANPAIRTQIKVRRDGP